MKPFLKQPRASSLLGLSLDANRLEGVLLRRTNGALEVRKTFSVLLSLDPLTNDPELVGQEIRNHLDKAEIRERRCAVSLPLNWVLTLSTKVPDLPASDLQSFLQIEAERGFPYGPEALLISSSCYDLPNGEQYATQVAVPKDHVLRLEKVLKAARLKPATFSLGIVALQNAEEESSNGVLALALGESSVGLQASCGGGVVALRALEGTFDTEDGQKRLNADVVARELRITLGQLPAGVRETIRRVRVLGQGDLARQLAEELQPRCETMGLKIEHVTGYSSGEFGVQLPKDARVSPAFSLAARELCGRSAAFEFLPPKISQWQQITTRYSSRKLIWAGATAGSVALLVGAAFLVQQWQLARLRSRWEAMERNATEIDNLQQRIKKFRPWFDDSLGSLSILRRLTEAFPEDGVVSAKTVEIRDLAAVTCTGTAQNSQALLKTLDQLRAVKEVTHVTIDQIRGGKPLQFTFNFHWNGPAGNEH
jgi:hypothetical protein